MEPGFQGAGLCLSDYYSSFVWPRYADDGRFVIGLSPAGELSIGTAPAEYSTSPSGAMYLRLTPTAPAQFTPTGVALEIGKWHTIGFAWDCERGTCALTVDHQHVADLPQRSLAPCFWPEAYPPTGICYLRLWSTAAQTDEAGLLVDSVSVSVKP